MALVQIRAIPEIHVTRTFIHPPVSVSRTNPYVRALREAVTRSIHGEALCDSNGWDTNQLTKLREHKQFRTMDGPSADQAFHRAELMEPAKLVPDEWMEESCAVGSVAHCVERLQGYRDAGADEIAVYASTPSENEKLIGAWRERTAAAQPAVAR